MQRGREGKRDLFDAGDPFDAIQRLGSFGSRETMMSGLFGGRDPFDDPFFTRPFDSMFEPSIFGPSTPSREAPPKGDGGKGILIEELNSDEENRESVKGITKHVGSGKEPSIEHPDDSDDDGKIQSVNYRNENDSHRVKGSKLQARSYSFQTSRVTYGGVDGTYYTSTKNRKTGSDGVVIEERKEADTTTGQATHSISRGIHDKGYSVTRKLNEDGKVDTTETLHNLNEDELTEFEKAWKGNGDGHLTGWSDVFSKPANADGVGSEGQLETSI
ncbi:uncharacterized protein LOC120141089 isoform X2 [Hibiscus syriacus]|uniref:uncharacterized protein LOC120141089 isoform X2 n=1 Tax=Hibiscus syriacus TaxID=106335 RepID=UPI001921B827|nr:uncharacterized protein LOC120141089 isoform X2 [Hibiscus syriacus]